MHAFRKFSAIVLAFMVLSSTFLVARPASADGVSPNSAAQIAYTGGDNVRYREGAGKAYPVKGSLAEGDEVWVLEGPVSDEAGTSWYRVDISGRIGWIMADFLAASSGNGGGSVAVSAPVVLRGDSHVAGTGGEGVRYREGASVNYDVKGKLAEGTTVAVLEGPVDGFYRISVSGRIGWVDARYLASGAGSVTAAAAPAAAPTSYNGVSSGGYAKVSGTNGDSLRVRNAAGGTVIAALAPGAVISVKKGPTWDDAGTAWFQVSGSSVSGWVMGKYLAYSAKPATTAAAPSNSSSASSNSSSARTGTARGSTAAPVQPPAANASSGGIVSTALAYVGSRYAYAGTTPAGFDCSGFTYYVFNKVGIKLSRSMLTQIAQGTKISSSNLQPGDLVYFSNTYKKGISHIAIYIGNGKIVHAINYGVGVGVSDLWSNYWASHYTGAVRIGG